MVEADFSGSFLNPLNAKQDEIGVVISGGQYEPRKNFKGEEYQQLVIEVEVNGKRLSHTPRTLEGRELVARWGKDTDKWVGKKFKIDIVNQSTPQGIVKKVHISPAE